MTQTISTRKEAKAYIKSLGLHYSYEIGWGDHRVAPKKYSEAQAYYTSDLQDAVDTATAMAAEIKAKEARS